MPVIPNAPLITIKQTPRGRGVFSLGALPKGTQLLTTDVITAHVINRAYRKEVCAQCFGYERGRTLKARAPKAGAYFCGPACLASWSAATSPPELAALEALEAFVKAKAPSRAPSPAPDAVLPDACAARPSPAHIRAAWAGAAPAAAAIAAARGGSVARPHGRALRAALAAPPAPDVLAFLLAGALSRAYRRGAWRAGRALAADAQPYAAAADLAAHVQAFLQLRAVVPGALVERVGAAACWGLAARDRRNAFGIRELGDAGEEYFGFALWPHASFFNHDCDPNVGKERVGRAWRFWLLRDVEADTELCISYLGGEERELNVNNRRARLKNNWDFECACDRCALESAEKDMQELYLGA